MNAMDRLRGIAQNTYLKTAAKLAITAIILTLLYRLIDPEQAIQRLRQVDPFYLTLAVLLGAAQAVLIMSWRWGIVLKVLGRSAPWRRLAHFMTVSLFFNEVLPSTIGGDTMRVVLLRRTGHPLGHALQSVVLERALGLASLLVLATVGALALLPLSDNPAPLWIIIGVAVAALGAAAVLIFLSHLHINLPIAALKTVAKKLSETATALHHDRHRLIALISLSFIGQMMIFMTVWLVAHALHIDISVWKIMAVMPAIILVASVPLSLAEWGVREGAMVVGLGLIGVSPTDAVTLSLIYGLIFLALGMMAGILWLFSRNRGAGKQSTIAAGIAAE